LTVQHQKFSLLSKVYEDVKGAVAQDVVYTSKSYTQAHHAEVVGFLKGLVQAIRFGKANPDPTKALIKQWVKVDDDEQLQASYDAYFTHEFESDPTPQPAAIQTNIDNEAKARGEQSTLKPADVIDPSFIKEALAALPN
jgi:ABC-type nitrate/sulfonate/bicarbonate transport system substrate-binding protein